MREVWRIQQAARQLQRAARRAVIEDRPPSSFDPVAVELRTVCRENTGLRPAYTYGVLRAAHTARALGLEKIWVAEMGVAAGSGLLSLGSVAEVVSARYGIGIDVVGFDTGAGLPAPTDPRDAPFALGAGDYVMPVDALRAKLRANTTLVLGDVSNTVPDFVRSSSAPLGFVANDLDYYTSTMASLVPLMEAAPDKLLPRVVMYFDDLIGYPYTTENGEYAAIRDLNAKYEHRPIGQVLGLRFHIGSPFDSQPWSELIYTLEVRDHPRFMHSERTTTAALTLG